MKKEILLSLSLIALSQLALAAPKPGAAVVKLAIASKGDENAFDKAELSAKAGQAVELTFTNTSKGSNMPHNWTLVKKGAEAEVANAGMSAGESGGWLVEGPNVIAHTKLLQPGTSETVKFTAPAKGDYPFICTYPGHYTTMKGTLHVK